MKSFYVHQKTGKTKRTDFISMATNKTIIQVAYKGPNEDVGAILSNLTIKELEKLVKIAKARKKKCKNLGFYYVHISPDVAILMKGNKK